MREIQAYASLALVGANTPLVSGKPYTFRTTISTHPPEGYQGKPCVLVGDLPQAPQAFFASPGLEEGIQGPVAMLYDERGETATATFQVTAKGPCRTGVIVTLLDGEEQIQSLHLAFEIICA
jgi:hypothetical protein